MGLMIQSVMAVPQGVSGMGDILSQRNQYKEPTTQNQNKKSFHFRERNVTNNEFANVSERIIN